MKLSKLPLVLCLCATMSLQSCDILLNAFFDGINTMITHVIMDYNWRCGSGGVEIYGTLENTSESQISWVDIDVTCTFLNGGGYTTVLTVRQDIEPGEEIEFSGFVSVSGTVTSVECQVSSSY